MAVGATRASNRRSIISTYCIAASAALLLPAAAKAVVVEGLNILVPPPSGGWVGVWNGSSAVPVAPNWIVTANHVGGSAGQRFYLRGQFYEAVEVFPHANLDIQLIRLASPVPHWHEIAPQQFAGNEVYLGGCGATTLLPLPGNAGWDWAGPHMEAWGRNRIETAGSMLRVRFDAPSSPGAVAQEAAFAIHDSGAGLFVAGSDGRLLLAGTAVSVSGTGASAYGSSSYSVSLHAARPWIDSVIGTVQPPPMICNLFEFLSLWFSHDPAADFDGNQAIEVSDLFAYLSAWFAGC